MLKTDETSYKHLEKCICCWRYASRSITCSVGNKGRKEEQLELWTEHLMGMSTLPD